MKDIWTLMDVIHAKTFRPFLWLAIINTGILVGDYVFRYAIQILVENMNHVVILPNTIYFLLVFDLLMLLILHIRSQQRFSKTGGLQRIQLLPISKYVYIAEEVLFTFMTICIILLGIYVGIGLIYLLHGWWIGNIPNGFIYMILNDFLLTKLLMPINAYQIVNLFLWMMLSTMLYTTLKLASSNGYYLSEVIFTSVGIGSLIFLFIGILGTMLTNWIDIVMLVIMFAVSIYLYWRLQRAFANGMLGG